MKVHSVRTPGLGDSTYILVHDSLAIVIDPQRDIDRFEKVLSQEAAELRLVLETHVHNDYVSGGLDLASKTGAELVMPAGAAPVFRHRPAFHREDIVLGSLRVRPLHTPGHTPEHVSYVMILDSEVLAVFSGGSLLVGAAGRTDLLGKGRAESLTRLQYGSVHRLAGLPAPTELFPTHGAGSFCATTGASAQSSTIGTETDTNPVLAYPDEDSFVEGQMSGLPPYPSYYTHMGPINLTGLGPPDLDPVLLSEIPADVTVIDARPRDDFASGHLPGSLGVELSDSFGTWIGWITDQNTPLVIVLNDNQDQVEAARQLARIGYDQVSGFVRPDERFTESYRTVAKSEFIDAIGCGEQVLDVRAPDEWAEGIVEGSIRSYVPDLARGIPPDLDATRPVWLLCGTGFRATIAASIVQDRGFEPIVLAHGGATDVLDGGPGHP